MRPAGMCSPVAGGKGARPVTQAWYRVASLSYGYAGAAIIILVALLALRRQMADRALWRRVQRNLPQAGMAGVLRVLSAGNRKLAAGAEIPVPYEGTLGSAYSCDVRIAYRKVHLRSAFFWMEHGALHMVALHRDGFHADDVPVEPGDEAVLHDGAVLKVGDLKLVLRLNRTASHHAGGTDEPYVTTARRSKAQQGRGDGLGAPGKAEARREKRRYEKKKKATARADRDADAAQEKAQTRKTKASRAKADRQKEEEMSKKAARAKTGEARAPRSGR